MARELEGFIIQDDESTLTLTKRPDVSLRRAAPAALFLALCVGGAIATVLGLATGGEWAAMSNPQRSLNVGVVLALSSMSVVFARTFYFALDRGFRIRAGSEGLSLRRHHFARLELPRELITAVHVRGWTYRPPRQPRFCQVRIELGLEGIDDELDLFGLGKAGARDEADNRARLTKAGLAIGERLAAVLGVPVEHHDFPPAR